jgi:hypothetical protein
MKTFDDTRLEPPYWALRITFILVPILAGLDKFTNLLAYWPRYLSPAFARLIPMAPTSFMKLVGVVEIVAGLIVLSKFARVGAYIVMVWLLCIALNLVAVHQFDVAVRDVAMAVGAFALAQLDAVRAAANVPAGRRVHKPATATT